MKVYQLLTKNGPYAEWYSESIYASKKGALKAMLKWGFENEKFLRRIGEDCPLTLLRKVVEVELLP